MNQLAWQSGRRQQQRSSFGSAGAGLAQAPPGLPQIPSPHSASAPQSAGQVAPSSPRFAEPAGTPSSHAPSPQSGPEQLPQSAAQLAHVSPALQTASPHTSHPGAQSAGQLLQFS
ncbi:MAG: hypothetical protein ACREE7_05075, partial [Dongiaceae bacterium]